VAFPPTWTTTCWKSRRKLNKKTKKRFSYENLFFILLFYFKGKNGNLTLRNPGVGCWAPLTRAPVCLGWEGTAWGSRDSEKDAGQEEEKEGGGRETISDRGFYTMPVVDCRPSSWPVHVPTHSESLSTVSHTRTRHTR
jgi:hypothetical protein